MLLEKVKAHRTIDMNRFGRNFFVGDIHGNKTALINQLNELAFDFTQDRLFCAGDLIDRGPESKDCLELLMEPWFFSTLGNHEAMFLQGFDEAAYWGVLLKNGGRWINDYQDDMPALFSLAQLIRIKMSLSITVKTAFGNIGVVHANAPKDWLALQTLNVNHESVPPYIWQRTDFSHHHCLPIANVMAVVHGHNSVAKYQIINNQLWIDTYSKSGKFTILEDIQIAEKIKRSH
ncbi:metallophosphoesterase [Thalassotalea sediminis]|uniref:metallophosphoesterase n=1 Tax=Thalassotalea sediminis TaxID=1759089 RepID=UPI00257428E9|nr:metallophosphoesterase [Thalassotalea sediminis]